MLLSVNRVASHARLHVLQIETPNEAQSTSARQHGQHVIICPKKTFVGNNENYYLIGSIIVTTAREKRILYILNINMFLFDNKHVTIIDRV